MFARICTHVSRELVHVPWLLGEAGVGLCTCLTTQQLTTAGWPMTVTVRAAQQRSIWLLAGVVVAVAVAAGCTSEVWSIA